MAAGNLSSVYHLAQASHHSCRDLYHISTPRIEDLVAKALTAGAGAARITGAGFGGCIVAFVPVEKSQNFLAEMKSGQPSNSPIIEAKSLGRARITTL